MVALPLGRPKPTRPLRFHKYTFFLSPDQKPTPNRRHRKSAPWTARESQATSLFLCQVILLLRMYVPGMHTLPAHLHVETHATGNVRNALGNSLMWKNTLSLPFGREWCPGSRIDRFQEPHNIMNRSTCQRSRGHTPGIIARHSTDARSKFLTHLAEMSFDDFFSMSQVTFLAWEK